MKWILFALLLGACLPGSARAHELQYSVGEGRAVFVTVSRSDGRAFAFEHYEIFRGDEESPFQAGRTDARGRLLFLPDQAGTWRAKVFSEDGHGVELSLSTDAHGEVEKLEARSLGLHLRIIVGVCILFGLFGVAQLFWRRRSEHD